ncbi:MAG: hypothetical protein FJZ01_05780 [Candidatus Sericytochromatia bacterium]|nr:hypothetical protein [Candidatus Tanganyikabacteria bacterium]
MSRFARLAAVLLAVAAGGAGCSLRPGQGDKGGSHGGPAIAFHGVSLVEYAGATALWRLEADHVRYDDRIARLDGVTLHYYRGGKVDAVCRASGASFDTVSRDLVMDGPVDFTGRGGHMVLEGARWVGNERKLVAGQMRARFQVAADR